MNYLHDYHAGSAADVFKHIVLLALLKKLQGKEKPFCYIDTHSGAGKYNLLSGQAAQTKEFESGILQLQNKNLQHPLLQEYWLLAQNFSCYPGSPTIGKHCLRTLDQMILIDTADGAYERLKQQFRHDKQVHIHQQDGYIALKALLPPYIKRGLVLIDPPYENPFEFSLAASALELAVKRWSTGCYAIWYPIKNREVVIRFHQRLNATRLSQLLVVEFCPWPDDVPSRLNGSGFVIYNPPWQIEETLQPLLNELMLYLKQHPSANIRIQRL